MVVPMIVHGMRKELRPTSRACTLDRQPQKRTEEAVGYKEADYAYVIVEIPLETCLAKSRHDYVDVTDVELARGVAIKKDRECRGQMSRGWLH